MKIFSKRMLERKNQEMIDSKVEVVNLRNELSNKNSLIFAMGKKLQEKQKELELLKKEKTMEEKVYESRSFNQSI